MSKLKNLDVFEISLVREAANNRKFLLFKDKGDTMDELINQVLDVKIEKEDEFVAELNKAGLSEKAIEALKAALKLLKAVENDLPQGTAQSIMSTLAQWAGYGYPEPGIKKPIEGEKTPSEGKEKYGYPKYGYPKYGYPKYGYEEVKKSLSDLPEEKKSILESFFKTFEENEKELTEIKKKLEEEQIEREKKELLEKANSFTNLCVDKNELGDLLFRIRRESPESFEHLEKMLNALNNQQKVSSLTKEIGSSKEAPKNAWERLESLALNVASDKKITKAKALDIVLKTEEGKKLYEEFNKEREN